MNMKTYWQMVLAAVAMLFAASDMAAQSGTTGYEYLSVPVSAHSAALGSQNISIGEDDATLMFNNPALLSNVSSNTVNFDFISYIAGSKKLAAGYVRALGDRGTWAVGAQMLTYGKMTETDASGAEIGTFSANDIDVQGSYAYMLSDYWSGGVSAKFLFSKYANYNAFAMAVDLGINYYNEGSGTSLSLVGRNLGGQIKALHEERAKLPFDLAVGLSQSLANAPIRFSVTFDDLTHWKDINFIQHCILGVDVFPSGQTWIALGYNFRRAHEMKALGSAHWAGFSVGAGLSIKSFKVGVAFGKYHIAASSLLANVSYTF